MTYYLLLEGQGEGCDYSIDCNKTYVHFKARDCREAEQHAMEICSKYNPNWIAIKSAILIESAYDKKLNMEGMYRQMAADEATKAAEREETERKKKFEELKREFEPKT